jgi:transcriptional regulator with XRE-family HTH domain
MAAEGTAGNLGAKLRAARERRGATVRQIANVTKMTVSTIEALERNDISRLPGGIFSRAFVRAYASEVGLDPDAAIEDFLAQFPLDSLAAGHASSRQIEDREALASDRRIASTVLQLVAFSMPLVGCVLYFGAAGLPRPSRSGSAGGQPVSTGIVPDRPARLAGTGGSESAASRLSVEVVASRRLALWAIVDGEAAPERALVAGDRATFDVRRDLELKIGDASAISWTLNGAPARTLGASGEVVTTRVTIDNYKDFLVVP